MNRTEGSGGSGTETAEEAMDVAVTTAQGNLMVIPGGASTLLPATDAQSQDADTPAAAAVTAGDFVIYNSHVGNIGLITIIYHYSFLLLLLFQVFYV